MGMKYYKAFYDLLDKIEPLTNEERGRLFTALLLYSRDGIVPEMGREVLTFHALKPQIDQDITDYKKRVENGKKGGRPKTKQNQEKPNETTKNQIKVIETKGNKDKDKDKDKDNINNKLSGKPDSVHEIIDHLNTKCGTHYRESTPATVRLIRARMAEGFTVDDFKTVIDNMHGQWSATDMAQFLRPETLFGTKFESYLNRNAKAETKTDLMAEAFARMERGAT